MIRALVSPFLFPLCFTNTTTPPPVNFRVFGFFFFSSLSAVLFFRCFAFPRTTKLACVCNFLLPRFAEKLPLPPRSGIAPSACCFFLPFYPSLKDCPSLSANCHFAAGKGLCVLSTRPHFLCRVCKSGYSLFRLMPGAFVFPFLFAARPFTMSLSIFACCPPP